MKKLLIGCGVLALLLFCLLVGGFIYGYIKVKAYTNGLVQVKNAYEATNKAYPFTAPDPPAMKPDRFKKYLAVREELATALGDEIDKLNELQDAANRGEKVQPGEVLAQLKNMLNLPKRLGAVHTAALEKNQMSVDEYLWHSKIVMGTLLKAARNGENLSDKLSGIFGQIAAQEGLRAGMASNKRHSAEAAPRMNQSPEAAPGKDQSDGSASGESAAGESAAGKPGIGAPDLDAMEALFHTKDVPLLPENLELINGAKDELSKYPQLISVDLFLRNTGLGPSAGPIAGPSSPAGAPK